VITQDRVARAAPVMTQDLVDRADLVARPAAAAEEAAEAAS
jgi:hypothetical protein